MKVLFVHDGPILSNKNKDEFYGVHYDDNIVNRYVYFGDVVTFLMRNQIISEHEKKKYSKITHKAFNLIEIPNFKSIKSLHKKAVAKKIIYNAVIENDIIIVRLPSAAGVIAKKIAEKYNKPVLVEVVACVYDALWNYDWRGKLLANFKKNSYQKTIKKSTHVVYVTKDYLQNVYPTEGKNTNCSNVVLNQQEDNIIQKRLNKINSKSNSELLVLCTVAAVDVEYKGQSNVIKAVALLKEQNILVKYKIVGQGNPIKLQLLIKKLKVEHLIEIVGPLKHDKIFSYLDDIDVYIQPSKTEGLPRAVVEALSRACPAIGSNVGGIPELIQKDLLFNPNSVSEIMHIIKKIKYKSIQISTAEENFLKAREYRLEAIESRRIEFYNQFKRDYNLK